MILSLSRIFSSRFCNCCSLIENVFRLQPNLWCKSDISDFFVQVLVCYTDLFLYVDCGCLSSILYTFFVYSNSLIYLDISALKIYCLLIKEKVKWEGEGKSGLGKRVWDEGDKEGK